MLRRKMEEKLKQWKNAFGHKPLVILTFYFYVGKMGNVTTRSDKKCVFLVKKLCRMQE